MVVPARGAGTDMGAAVWGTLRKVCTTLTGAVGFVIVGHQRLQPDAPLVIAASG